MTQQTLDPSGPDEIAPGQESRDGVPASDRAPVTLIDSILAHKVLVALCGLGAAVLVAAFTWITAPGVSTSGQLGLITPATGNVLLPVPSGDATMARYTAQRALFAKSDAVLTQVVDSVPGVTLTDLRRAITVTASKSANAIIVTATADTPEKALAIAQGVMDAYRISTSADVNERSESSAAGWEARGDEAKAEQVRIDGASFGDGVEFEVTPILQTPAHRIVNKDVALGLLVGLGFGALLAWYIEDARRRRGQRAVRGVP